MPQFNDSDEKQVTSLEYLIRTAFINYQTIISKYEALLVDNTTLNVLIKEKLSQLPIVSEIQRILNELMEKEGKEIKHQQDKLETKEDNNKKTTDQLITSLDKIVRSLIFELRVLLGWLTIASVVGGIAIAYVKTVTNEKIEKQTKEIVDTRGPMNQQDAISYWIDEKGVKRFIHVEVPQKTNEEVHHK